MNKIHTDVLQGIIAPKDMPPAPVKRISVRSLDFARTVEVARPNALSETNWIIDGFTSHSTIFRSSNN